MEHRKGQEHNDSSTLSSRTHLLGSNGFSATSAYQHSPAHRSASRQPGSGNASNSSCKSNASVLPALPPRNNCTLVFPSHLFSGRQAGKSVSRYSGAPQVSDDPVTCSDHENFSTKQSEPAGLIRRAGKTANTCNH
jgi:hypothetical protein